MRKFFDSEKERILTRGLEEKNALKKQLSDAQTEIGQLNEEVNRREDEASHFESELHACQHTLQ